jgi:23S rRNA (adenine2030-N6)-methyltransferase
MNYRHAYHAGNFADVVKHALLVLVIEHLKQKEAPFRVIDTHAGVGMYELAGAAAAKTGEWREGIGRLLGTGAAPIPAELQPVLAPYLALVQAANPEGQLRRYPGSPWIARRMLRPGDRLIANELHVEDGLELKALFARDRQAKVLNLDGWTTLKSLVPPPERRGVILVDPPFEEPGEFERMRLGLAAAVRRFATGTYILWFPIKDMAPIEALHRGLAAMELPKLLIVELLIRAPRNPDRLNGTGLVVLNPPYRLEQQLSVLLPFLAERLAQAPGSRHRLAWLSGGAADARGTGSRRR